MKFGEWLMQFSETESPIGDLSRDMIRNNDIASFNEITSPNNIPFHLGKASSLIEEALTEFNPDFQEQ